MMVSSLEKSLMNKNKRYLKVSLKGVPYDKIVKYMNEKQVFGIVLTIAGIGLLIFGISHINSGYSQLRAAMGGGEDVTGILSSVSGALIAIVGLSITLIKTSNTLTEPQADKSLDRKNNDIHNIPNIQNNRSPSETATTENIKTPEETVNSDFQRLNPENDIILKLKQFKQLLDDGILTQEEYQKQKNKILNS